jgi:hypothetical protein
MGLCLLEFFVILHLSEAFTVCAVEVIVTSYTSCCMACLMTPLFVAAFGLQVLIFSVIPLRRCQRRMVG